MVFSTRGIMVFGTTEVIYERVGPLLYANEQNKTSRMRHRAVAKDVSSGRITRSTAGTLEQTCVQTCRSKRLCGSGF